MWHELSGAQDMLRSGEAALSWKEAWASEPQVFFLDTLLVRNTPAVLEWRERVHLAREPLTAWAGLSYEPPIN